MSVVLLLLCGHLVHVFGTCILAGAHYVFGRCITRHTVCGVPASGLIATSELSHSSVGSQLVGCWGRVW